MKEFAEKLIGRLEELNCCDIQFAVSEVLEKYGFPKESVVQDEIWDELDGLCTIKPVISIVNQLAEEYNGYALCKTREFCDYQFLKDDGWIPCSERLPTAETKVLILAKRKYRDGSFKNIITTAMYEDGTMLENDSRWRWEDIEGKWDEENDCYIIPEGWWEDKMYNADGELNHLVDDEVLYWQPLPQEPYQKGE